MTSKPRVIVTVLNYNRADDTIECVNSLFKTNYPSMEILLVDNCSTDGSYEKIREAFPEIKVIRNEKNLGYTGGVNVSIMQAQLRAPDYIMVLNNDTLVDPQFIDYLVDAMEKHKTAAAACGTIYYHPDVKKIWYAGGRLIPWRGLAVHDHKGEYLEPSSLEGVHKVSFITGCLILFRASHLPAIGLEDERFFIYLDDIELSARILRKGFDLLYTAKAIIYHKVAGEGESPFKLYYSVRNRFLTIALGFRGLSRVIAMIYFSIVIAGKILVWMISKPVFFKAAKYGLVDFFRGNLYEGRGLGFPQMTEQTIHNS